MSLMKKFLAEEMTARKKKFLSLFIFIALKCRKKYKKFGTQTFFWRMLCLLIKQPSKLRNVEFEVKPKVTGSAKKYLEQNFIIFSVDTKSVGKHPYGVDSS